MTERLRIAVEGVVQGVGFRPFVYGLATRHGVRGFVANRAGDVVIEAEGGALDRFVAELHAFAPGRIDRVTATELASCGDPAFRIAASEVGTEAAAIAPDLATCEACVAEVLGDGRRAGYPFTSCAACGPRLTIVTEAPYDRARTTMAGFAMCATCRAEHDDPTDRRFHAQPIACPACGPQLEVPIPAIAERLAHGGIVAIKGLGGFHLACDAGSEAAIAELRRRKHRDAKPFAVMVPDLDAARALAEVDDASAALLVSPARPIVLVPRRRGLADAIAPGLADIGLMLPYTPLHHLLLRETGALVMTSGNVTDEPIAFRDDDARARLAPIADAIVVHDRPIHMRCDDSVVRAVGGAPMILRRARGYAPAPIRLPVRLAQPTLALGGHLKATFALAAGDVAFVSPHIGDLDHPSALDAFAAALEHFERLHRITPARVVHDRHPDYATTRLAGELGLPAIAIQHHHAHFASALADAGLVGPAIGVIFDGAGHGDDGAIWGGEIFVGDVARVERVAHLPYVPQPGGDAAAREPVRMAVAYLHAAGEDASWLPGGDKLAALCDHPRLAPPTSSAGRLFDAVAALCGIHAARFEGEAAMRLEALARTIHTGQPYPFDGMRIDFAAIAADARACVPPAVIARRFHVTIVELAAAAVERAARDTGLVDVVLSGGVFQNAILAAELPARLGKLRVHVHHHVPPNDGGLALGQLAASGGR